MNKTSVTKILAAMLAFILTFANVILLGIYTRESIAASTNLEEQSTQVANADVEFDAYFEEEGEQTHSKDIDIATNDDNIYIKIKVTDGYLANGTVKLQNSNFKLVETDDVLTHVQSIDPEEGEIRFNQIGKGESVILRLPIVMNTDSNFDITNLNKITSVELEGTYVDNTGNEKSISKSIDVIAKIIVKTEGDVSKLVDLEVEDTKKVAYDEDSNKGFVAQYKIKSSLKNNVLPVKETKIEINIPKLNNTLPQRVSLLAISTKATNGEEEKIFTSDDYTYENGKVTLSIKNDIKDDRTVSWEKDAQDEILLTCAYIDTYGLEDEEYTLEGIEVTDTILPYANDNLELVKNIIFETSTSYQKVGEIVTYDVETVNELQKGYMLVEGAANTPYTEKWTVDIGNIDLTDSVILENNVKYLDENNNEYESNPIYTYTKVSENVFLNMLGEDGYINIYNKEGGLITTLNKDNLEYRYNTETTYIKVETSKPIQEGIIVLENERAIKAAEYNKSQTESFKKIITTVSGKINYGTRVLFNKQNTKEIQLIEPKTTVDAIISKTNLSTQEVNEGVRLIVALDTSDISNRLYKNPKVIVEFPSYIKEVNAQAGVLYGQGLEYDAENTKQYTNSQGNIVLEICTLGEQTEYNTSSVSNGAYIIVQGDIIADELTPAIKESIKVTVINEDETVLKEIEVSYAAENKIITRSSISGYSNENNEIKALNSDNTAVIAYDNESRTATMKIDVVNSTSEDITNVMILGRIPFAGNKAVISGTDLGSTFTMNLLSNITATYGVSQDDIDVYYTNNGTATRDIEDMDNGWTKTPSNLSEIKSYLIICKDSTIANGTRMSFTYNVQIPENIGEEKAAYGTFAVFYNNGNNVIKSEEAHSIGLVTSQTIPEEGIYEATSQDLDITVTEASSGNSLALNAEVREGQYIDYTVTIENKTTDRDLTLDLEVAKENGTFYGLEVFDHVVEYTEFGSEEGAPLHRYNELTDETLTENITIEAGKTYTYKYTIVVNKDTEGNNLTSTVSLKQNDVKIIEDLTTVNPIIDGLIKLNVKYNRSEESLVYSTKTFSFEIDVTNITMSSLENVIVEVDLPEILTFYDDDGYRYESDYRSVEEENNKLTFKIDSIGAGDTAKIFVITNVGSIGINEELKNIQLKAKATVNGEVYYSNIYGTAVLQGETIINATMTGSVQGEYVENGQEIIYTININNSGNLDEYLLRIRDSLPKCLRVIGYTIIDNDGNETEVGTDYNELNINDIQIDSGKNVTVKIKTEVITSLAKSEIIENKATLSGQTFETFDTNTVTYKLKDYVEPEDPEDPEDPSNPENPENPDNPDNPTDKTYIISGRAWIDVNSDGKRDNNDSPISDVTVMLMNNEKSEFVKDSSGKQISTVTSSDGTYRFEGLKEGEYVVVFIYNTELYDVATYQKSGVNTSQNSDAIESTVRISEADTKVAATDILKVNENKTNIDLGLVRSKIFDLKLDKMINTVIVQNKEGTTSYKFEGDKTAKVEIPAKYMVGTTLTIEYKISITNEGNVPGKVLKVIDYMPKELEFSSEINNEWYKGTDGNLYTQEFENIEINPGETKEISLVLTKTLKEEAAETINNYAEIQETYNVLGLADIDSVAGNNAQNEDDLSSADLIVTIKTGAMTYTLIALGTMILIGILGGGIYLIKKKVLN